jgi:hypothetical protein
MAIRDADTVDLIEREREKRILFLSETTTW